MQPRRPYELIEELLGNAAPVTLREILGWVDFRERRVMTYEELTDALEKLHRAGRLERAGDGYVAAGADVAVEPFRPPTGAEYDRAVAEYGASMTGG